MIAKKLKIYIVARRFEQEEDIDFFKIFAHIIRQSIVIIIIALIAKKQWKLQHLDIKTSFLNGKLKEEIYIILELGFEE